MPKRTFILLAAAVGVLAIGAFVPASAAPAKPFAGSYKLSLQPDPASFAFTTGLARGCTTLNEAASDRRAIKVPRAGSFKIVLDSPDPTGRGVTNWDMYVRDPAGEDLGASGGLGSHEEVVVNLKGKTSITIVVCNFYGAMDGTVTYTLTR